MCLVRIPQNKAFLKVIVRDNGFLKISAHSRADIVLFVACSYGFTRDKQNVLYKYSSNTITIIQIIAVARFVFFGHRCSLCDVKLIHIRFVTVTPFSTLK